MCHILLKGSETKENNHKETGSQSRVQVRGGAPGGHWREASCSSLPRA